MPARMRSFPLLLLWLALPGWLKAAEDRSFHEARFDRGQLKYYGKLPVLQVEGTPQQIGRQRAALTGEAARAIADYPRRLLHLLGRDAQWPKYVAMARQLVSQCPAAYRDELSVFGEKTGVDRDLSLLGNTIMDLHRGTFACSSLVVEPGKSATGQPLFGRNLDFYTLGVLEKYGLVTVCRPQSKHAFASIGFPGLLGCLSGMNDAGLALAVHEVYLAADGAPMFNSKGTPYTLCFRRILEECTTIDEAERLLRACQRTTMLNLAMCDRRGGAVLEMTPKTVAVRRAEGGICICTNHFRTAELSILPLCSRYGKLSRATALDKVGLADVAQKLHEVNQNRMTVQSMIFEPGPLVLHLGMGTCPSSKPPLERLPLAELLGKK